MLYLGIDNHTIYGIIGTGRETVTAIKITPNTALFSGFWEFFCPKKYYFKRGKI